MQIRTYVNVTFLRIYCSHHVSLLVILFVMEIRRERERERERERDTCKLYTCRQKPYQQPYVTHACVLIFAENY